MTTVINNPGTGNDNASSGGSGVVIGAVIVILVLAIAAFFGLPYIRSRINNATQPTNPTINVTLPGPTAPAVPATK